MAVEVKESHELQEPLLNNGDNSPLYSNANFLSILTFSWMSPLLSLGRQKRLDLDDIPHLASGDRANSVFSIFTEKLQFRSSLSSLQLAKSLIASAWTELLLSLIFSMVFTLSSFVGPYLIDAFVQYLDAHQDHSSEGYVLVSIFLFAKLVECVAQRHWFFRAQKFGMKAHAALVARIYEKGLTLLNSSTKDSGCGEFVNLISVDAERIGNFSWYMIDFCLVPVQVGLALVILYSKLGLASLVALAATMVVMATNIPFSKLEQSFQEKMMESKDRRMKATSAILRNMRILKLHGWEMSFLSKIMSLRENEMFWLRKFLYTEVVVTFVYWGAPIFVSLATFSACVIMGTPLGSGKTMVSIDRISTFLSLEERRSNAIEKVQDRNSGVAVEITGGNFSWDPLSESLTLREINLRVLDGMKVAVCGAVGSGKSSLLSCILGEIPKMSGAMKLAGSTAYVPQSPWIQSGTIESNILFGKEMNREKYQRVIEACALTKDLKMFPFMDQTIIGERGINLSGGQKQRIQIARALYQDSDIYLLDDPFSAIDAQTGNHLFKECMLGLFASKTVIYVTHQVEFLPYSDLILVMKMGEIIQTGKYDDILNSGSDFVELVSAHKNALSKIDSSGNSKMEDENSSQDKLNDFKKLEGPIQMNDDKVRQLVEEEERQRGNVGLKIYWKYLTALYNGALVPFILISQTLFQVLQIGSNYWMAMAAPNSEDSGRSPVSGSLLILVYAALALGSCFFVFVRALLVSITGYKTAKLLFYEMHRCVFRAPMAFFDSTPSGRILNRASKDQNLVDQSIPFQMGLVGSAIIQLFGTIAVMSQVAWEVFIVFVPMTALCIWYQKYYITTARELSRLVGVINAPIIQQFAETVSGLSIIRCFNKENLFLSTNLQLIDEYLRPKFYNAGAMEWLCFRLDLLSSLIFAFCLALLISLPPGVINPGMAGLAVTYGLSLSSLLAWVVWTHCSLENEIISVERILQYTCIPSEASSTVQSNHPPLSWPNHGELNITDLQIRYAPHLPLVLRDLTCTFHGGTRTGIVGRTGSGKSTLVQAIFRIVEPVAGRIDIDGINISTIRLLDLRTRLSIIPQDPTMFEGSVRSNLDPLEEYTDEQIWEALDKCQLGEEIRRNAEKLDSPVVENGENWSVGQRQLFCLGRVLLRKSKILVLDEATASVDPATDGLIQVALKHYFPDSTVLIIAHRIATVLDSDMILVLDNGRAVENDSPSNLLDNKVSAFSNLVAEYTSRMTL